MKDNFYNDIHFWKRYKQTTWVIADPEEQALVRDKIPIQVRILPTNDPYYFTTVKLNDEIIHIYLDQPFEEVRDKRYESYNIISIYYKNVKRELIIVKLQHKQNKDIMYKSIFANNKFDDQEWIDIIIRVMEEPFKTNITETPTKKKNIDLKEK